MDRGVEVDTLVPPGRLSALIARSETNIQRSRALVAAAGEIVRAAFRISPARLRFHRDGVRTRESFDGGRR